MNNASPQNGHGEPVHAMVLNFSNETPESTIHRYPEALPVPPPHVQTPPPPTRALKGDDSDSGAPWPPQTSVLPSSGPRDFSSGICDCHQSWAICADAWCCTYCIASAHHNFFLNEQEGIFWPLCCGLFCVDIGLSAISPYLPSSLCFHTCFMRSVIRQRYHLHSEAPSREGTDNASTTCNTEFLTDFLTVCFCLSCVVAQHQREIIRQGEWCGGVFSDRNALDTPGTVHAV